MPTVKNMLRGGVCLLGAVMLALFILASFPPSPVVVWGRSVSPGAASVVVPVVPTNTPACGLAWRGVNIPLPPGNSRLNGVVGFSPSDVWAVGSYGDGTLTQTLTMHWDGSQWSIVPSPNFGANSTLSAVAINRNQPSNGVWAVGYSGPAGASQTLVMRWDGSQWSIVPSPNPSMAGSNILDGVAFAGDNDVWAVGYYDSTPTYRTLVEHWDGTQWSIVPSPNESTGNNLLHAVTATGPNDVWAVGTHLQTNINLLRLTSIHWNGTSWNSTAPNPGYANNYFYAAFAIAPNDVWAGGGEEDMLHHWDGAQWGSPGVTVVTGDLYGVSGTAHNDVWAVGDIFGSGNSPIYHYDGNFFFPYPANSGTYLRGVAAISRTSAFTVGFDGSGHALIEEFSNPCVTPTGTPTATRTATPTNTPTFTATSIPTFTPAPSTILVGHVTWQGIGQPNVRNDGITATLSLCAGGTPQNFPVSTDASGFFTVTLSLPDGNYNWWFKGRKWLAAGGTLALSGETTHREELGQQRAGDSNNDNGVGGADFVILKSTFGKSIGGQGYDERGDLNNDNTVNGADFNLLKNNFGTSGAAANCP